MVEKVFSYPGLGSLCFESAKYHDYNMLLVLCLITGTLVIFINMLAQVINDKIDPRMKHDRSVTDWQTQYSDFEIVGENYLAEPIKIAEKPGLKKSRQEKPYISIGILLIIILGCTFSGVTMNHQPTYMDLKNINVAPNRTFYFGTDSLGRDIFSMIWYGGRISLFIGILATAISTFIAVVYGSISGDVI